MAQPDLVIGSIPGFFCSWRRNHDQIRLGQPRAACGDRMRKSAGSVLLALAGGACCSRSLAYPLAMATDVPPIEIGISESSRQSIADGLSRVLADTYTLYLKTHNFHWNVTGPMFQTLHLMFETHYNELALAVDLIAERIRALGHYAPGTYRAFSQLSSIAEADGVPAATDMIRELVAAHQTVAKTTRSVFPAAEAAADQATMDLLTQRLQVHEKTAWMLRSLLA